MSGISLRHESESNILTHHIVLVEGWRNDEALQLLLLFVLSRFRVRLSRFVRIRFVVALVVGGSWNTGGRKLGVYLSSRGRALHPDYF